jgi:glycosyltransferase involved in cell wall biosynthesis
LTIHVYAVCYNEEAILPYFLRHYSTFADKIIVFDGESKDRSIEILKAHPLVSVVTSSSYASHDEGMYDEPTLMKIRNRAYKASRGQADWVVIVDMDEFLYHPDLRGLLDRYEKQGVTLPLVAGFDMVAEKPPSGAGQIYDEIRTGFLNRRYSKSSIFNPEIDINFQYGCHQCFPEGKVVRSIEPEVSLLHYRFLGPDHFADKYMLRQSRMSAESRIMKWGTHISIPGKAGIAPLYPATRDDLKVRYQEIVASVEVQDAVAVATPPSPKLSVPLSIHNRTTLFKRALETYMWQTLPPEDWEIVLVDDCSTEDVAEAYRPLLGRINLRHVRFDHKLHPLFKERNPGWKPGDKENWVHTPALTTNLGCHMSRAPVVGLFHPEVMHAPENFERAVRILSEKPRYLFGKVWLGDKAVNEWLGARDGLAGMGWDQMMYESGAFRCRAFKDDELYWYCSFLPKRAVERVGGVDFEFMKGVAFEDCDFKERINRAGFPDLLDKSIQGMHQDHSNEQEAHRIRNKEWYDKEAINGNFYRTRLYVSGFPERVNEAIDWTARECVVQVTEYRVGSTKPIL